MRTIRKLPVTRLALANLISGALLRIAIIGIAPGLASFKPIPHSARASLWVTPAASARLDEPERPPAPARLIAGEIPFLAEPDFEEHQEQASCEPRRHQADRENFAGHAFDEHRTECACDDQHGGLDPNATMRNRPVMAAMLRGRPGSPR